MTDQSTTSDNPTLAGGCLCRAVRYRVSGAPLSSGICHCATCRHASAAPSVAWTVFRSVDVAFTAGEPARFASSPQVVRTFCGRCGTPLTFQHHETPQTIDVTTGSLDHPELFAPAREIWIAHRLPWEALNPSLLHHPRGSDDDAAQC